MNKYEIDAKTSQFIYYFETYYWEREEHWALCFWKNLGMNTNMFLVKKHETQEEISQKYPTRSKSMLKKGKDCSRVRVNLA